MHGAGNRFFGTSNFQYRLVKSSTTPNYDYWHHSDVKTTPTLSGVPEEEKIRLQSINHTKLLDSLDCPEIPRFRIRVLDTVHVIVLEFRRYYPIVFQSPQAKDSIRQIFDTLNLALNELNTEYNNLLETTNDYVTENFLRNSIYNDSPNDILTNLLTYSPLSDYVLHTLICEYPLLDTDFMEVMKYNMPVSNNVYDYLSYRLATVPKNIADTIISWQTYNPWLINPTPTLLSRTIEDFKTEKQLYFNDLMDVLSQDTSSYDFAKEMLMREAMLQHNMQLLLRSYIEEGNVDTVLAIAMPLLEEIGYFDEYVIDKDGKIISGRSTIAQDLLDWIDFTFLLIDLKTENRTFYELTAEELMNVYKIATRCPTNPTSAEAQSVLEYYYNIGLYICEDVFMKSTKYQDIDPSKFKTPKVKAFLRDCHPNPAKNYTNIGYYIPQGQTGQITLSDIYGHKIYEFKAYEGDNTIQISTATLSNGIYVYGLIVDGVPVEYKKLVIIK
jgi:hypothetical protein